MPLGPSDRAFLRRIEHMKLYLLVLAGLVFLYLLIAPRAHLQLTTSLIGLSLCAVFWLTQRLLAFIGLLDMELTRLTDAVKRSLPADQRRELFGE